MKEQYPDYTYEKLTGWLVDGYWKILPKNEYGHNMEGKSIKGIDWVKPYSNIEGQKVNSGTQEASLVPNHAIQRAKERYNLDLTETDLQEMATMCIQGKATRLNIRDKFGRIQSPKKQFKNGCYRLTYKDRLMDLYLSNSIDHIYRVGTFLPEPAEPNIPIVEGKVFREITKDCEKT